MPPNNTNRQKFGLDFLKNFCIDFDEFKTIHIFKNMALYPENRNQIGSTVFAGSSQQNCGRNKWVN